MIELLIMKFKSSSPEETRKSTSLFWDDFIKKPHLGALIICLYGDLGAGKTVFVQGLGEFLSLKEKINSPTFVIGRKYQLDNNEFENFFHFDFYRLEDIKDLDWLNWSDIINNRKNVIIIEWPERIEKFLPKERFNLSFEVLDEKTRNISYEER